MEPFEHLIHELGNVMGITLHPDTHQSCRINFPPDKLSIQIDLDVNATQILMGTQLGILNPGTYREQIFFQAMRVNGTSITPRGILAYSEKNGTLVLFQFLDIASLNGEKLHNILQLFREHAKVWKEAIQRGEVPIIEEQATQQSGEKMYGL